MVPLQKVEIAIFGLDNAGKTCVLNALTGNFDFETVPTVGLGQKEFMYEETQVSMYDLGGSSNFRNVWTRFYAALWGFVYVADSADADRLEESKEVLDKMKTHAMMTGKPFVLIANKQDLDGAASGASVRESLGVGPEIKVFEAAATRLVDGAPDKAISDAVEALLKEIVNKAEYLRSKVAEDTEKQDQIDKKEREEKRKRIEERMRESRTDTEAIQGTDTV